MIEITSIRRMINDAVKKSGTLRLSIIKGAWQGITKELGIKSEPLGIKDGVLYTAVENSICLHAMEMRKDRYIADINKLLKGEYIVDIKYRVKKIDIKAKLERGDNLISLEKRKETKLTEYKTKDMTIEESIKYLASMSKKREKILFENGYRRCEKCNDLFLGREKLCPKCRGIKERVTINKY